MIDDPVRRVSEVDELIVRPYVITSGRTVGAAGDIPIEALVVANMPVVGLNPDQAAVVGLCRTPISVAEISAYIRQPLGVARVLVADLTATGHVLLHDTAASENAAIVRRLLNGIRSL